MKATLNQGNRKGKDDYEENDYEEAENSDDEEEIVFKYF